jgi:hypothetical protein
LIGQISDSLKAAYGADALRNAAVACCGFYFIAALLALLAVRPLRSAWVDEPMS